MKRFISIASGILILTCVIALILETTSAVNAKTDTSVKGTTPLALTVGRAQTVAFDVDSYNLRQLSKRERTDQQIDWLMLTALMARGASIPELQKTAFDLPPARYGYLHSLGVMEFGSVRSRDVGNGHIVALVPAAGTAAEKSDRLAHVFDDQWKDAGEQPRVLELYEYQLDPLSDQATLTRKPDVPGSLLIGKDYGYIQQEIHGAHDLESFLSNVHDIVYVNATDDTLTLGGRKFQAGTHLGATLEDVAALWQSDRDLQRRLHDFEAPWQAKLKQLESEGNTLGWSQAQYDQAAEQVVADERAAAHEKRIVSDSGFSLDPATDYDGVRRSFEEFTAAFAAPSAQMRSQFQEVEAGLKEHDETALFDMLHKIQGSGESNYREIADKLLKCVYTRNQFQIARYDGSLQGTEAGMVLFYTDLLAKLWALSFDDSSPVAGVPEFPSMLHDPLSGVFARETEVYAGTRLWFGPNNGGFQSTAGGNALVMSHIASRVYAASSDPLEPGVEKEAAAWSAGFLNWWNDHYEEVAAYEPQYQRLNEIMKWSLVLSWLNKARHDSALKFLADVPVKHDRVFPGWARNTPGLRFRQWNTIGFYPAGYMGTTTEALPRLYSGGFKAYPNCSGNHYSGHLLSGGVSLAERSLFEERVTIPLESPSELRRSMLDWKQTDLAAGKLQTFDGMKIDLSKQAETQISPAPAAKLRTRDGDFALQDARYAFAANDDSFRIESRLGSAPVGELNIQRQPGGFSVRWKSREVDRAQSLANDLSMAPGNLARRTDLQSWIQLPGTDHYLVRFKGSDRWVELAPEAQPTPSISEGWKARVSDPLLGARNINVAWHEAAESMKVLPEKGYIRFIRAAAGEPTHIEVALRPEIGADSARVEVAYQAGLLHGFVSQDKGVLELSVEELSNAKLTANDAQSVLESIDLRSLPAAEKDSGVIRLAAGNGGGRKPPPGSANRGFMDWGEPEFVQRITDPRAFKASIDAELRAQLELIDNMLQQRDLEGALAAVDDARRTFPDHPELQLREGLLRLYSHDSRNAAEQFSQISAEGGPQRQHIFEELDARIAAERTDSQRGSLRRLLEYLRWKSDPKLDVAAGRMDLLGDADGRVKLAFLLDDDGRFIHKALDPKGPLDDSASLYVEDSPGFNNTDWTHWTQDSLREVLLSGRGRLYDLSTSKISVFSPDEIHVARSSSSANAASSPSPGRNFHYQGQVPRMGSSGRNSCSANDSRPGDPGCPSRPSHTYVLVDSNQA